jgi:hypothetical protein
VVEYIRVGTHASQEGGTLGLFVILGKTSTVLSPMISSF